MLLAVAAAGGAGYAVMALSDARSGADAAARDLAACQVLAARIDRLKERPPIIGTAEADHAELTARIERAASAAGMPPAALVQITPGPDRRLGDSAYVEKPTAVVLGGVALRPLAAFLQALTADRSRGAAGASHGDDGPHLTLRDLRLSTPPGQSDIYLGSTELWSADLTLVYRIYRPRSREGTERRADE